MSHGLFLPIQVFVALLLFAPHGAAQIVAADHHQHLFRESLTQIRQTTARDLITLLDEAQIRRAAVLSIAYQLGNPNRPPVENEYERVKAENDWTGEQVAQFPERLLGFCSVNPLKSYALAEIARCGRNPQLRVGLKLHFGNSDVDLENPEHVRQLKRVFREADQLRMAIIVHMRPSVTKNRPYGANHARIFLNELIPEAPDVIIQIAHLAGAGGFDDPAVDQALGVFIAAVAGHDKRMRRVYFDISGLFDAGDTLAVKWTANRIIIAARIRELGIDRILYGSDNLPGEVLPAFRKLPLTADEFRIIESNLAPYFNCSKTNGKKRRC